MTKHDILTDLDAVEAHYRARCPGISDLAASTKRAIKGAGDGWVLYRQVALDAISHWRRANAR